MKEKEKEWKSALHRDLFVTKDMGNGITCIEDASNVMLYLIEGSHHALLVDTGTGIGNVSVFLKSLTKLPVYTVVTHGHVDHGGGCYDFDEIYIPPEDVGLLAETTNVSLRREFAEKSRDMAVQTGQPAACFDMGDFTPPRKIRIRELTDGMEFDLGGRTITAVQVPGHTPGFTALYDDMTRSLFAGDCGNPSTFLFLKECTSLTRYYEALLSLKERYGDKIDHWYISHMLQEVPVSILDELLECCEAVFEGRAAGQHFHFDFADMGSDDAYFVYPAGENQLRLDGCWGNIVYNKKNIGK